MRKKNISGNFVKNQSGGKVINTISITLTTSICLVFIFFVNSCKSNISASHNPDIAIHDEVSQSITKYSDETDKYYEETDSGYKAAFYKKDEISVKRISDWLVSCEPSDGYYQYIYSDPDSWDMFIYYSPGNVSFNNDNLKFSVDGTVVKVTVTNDSANQTSEDYTLIRIQAPLRGAWPTSSELYIDGSKIELQDSQLNV